MKTVTALLIASCMLSGCLEKDQVAGDYRGKPDAKPYEANFGGDKGKWETTLRARNQAQNEYVRVQ